MSEDIFASMPYGKAALAKIKPTDPNFRLYSAGWLGDYDTTDTMEVAGAVFREAKSGPRKGELCILVPGTKRTAYVTVAEMDVYRDDYPAIKIESERAADAAETRDAKGGEQ